jgi:hypothetical protein
MMFSFAENLLKHFIIDAALKRETQVTLAGRRSTSFSPKRRFASSHQARRNEDVSPYTSVACGFAPSGAGQVAKEEPRK